ncbi:unnamed protein product, partial [Ectocarpus fasciculatus]
GDASPPHPNPPPHSRVLKRLDQKTLNLMPAAAAAEFGPHQSKGTVDESKRCRFPKPKRNHQHHSRQRKAPTAPTYPTEIRRSVSQGDAIPRGASQVGWPSSLPFSTLLPSKKVKTHHHQRQRLTPPLRPPSTREPNLTPRQTQQQQQRRPLRRRMGAADVSLPPEDPYDSVFVALVPSLALGRPPSSPPPRSGRSAVPGAGADLVVVLTIAVRVVHAAWPPSPLVVAVAAITTVHAVAGGGGGGIVVVLLVVVAVGAGWLRGGEERIDGVLVLLRCGAARQRLVPRVHEAVELL